MKIYKNIENFIPVDNAVVTIGTFDGVHIGHQKILSNLKASAKEINGETVLLTFFPHPRMVLHPEEDNLRLISTIEEKAHLLANCGIDHLIITPFTKEFSQQSPEDYIRDVLVSKIGTKKIVVGYDHRFGKDRAGSLTDLLTYASAFGYSVQEISEQDINDVTVSSTKIREALIKGQIEVANSFLGYPYELTGFVIKGKQIGKEIGFPTANLSIIENYKLIPAYGIYAVEASVVDPISIEDGEFVDSPQTNSFKGMGYIGTQPTINGTKRSIEVNLFDFDSNLYEKTLRVKFLHFIRQDIRFDSLEEMIQQIGADEKAVRAIFD